jgi:hypothetical protein
LTSIAHGRGERAQDRLLRTAARGAILIGVAMVIGIVLLQIVDNGGGGGSFGVGSTSDDGKTGRTTTTTVGGRPVQEVAVLVLNGTGVSQAAATEANKLRGLGYAIAGTGNTPVQTGTTIGCREGYEKEAEQLAATIDPSGGATIVPFPEPAPADSDTASCIVFIGKAAE